MATAMVRTVAFLAVMMVLVMAGSDDAPPRPLLGRVFGAVMGAAAPTRPPVVPAPGVVPMAGPAVPMGPAVPAGVLPAGPAVPVGPAVPLGPGMVPTGPALPVAHMAPTAPMMPGGAAPMTMTHGVWQGVPIGPPHHYPSHLFGAPGCGHAMTGGAGMPGHCPAAVPPDRSTGTTPAAGAPGADAVAKASSKAGNDVPPADTSSLPPWRSSRRGATPEAVEIASSPSTPAAADPGPSVPAPSGSAVPADATAEPGDKGINFALRDCKNCHKRAYAARGCCIESRL